MDQEQTDKQHQCDQAQGPFTSEIAPVGPIFRRKVSRRADEESLDGNRNDHQR
ncbi:MAG: hypothetical protein BAJATHORv1_150004 [Candidatus Thorarchaeota archaeon]|nr:MAG: hypothetical protein BAJATHORv1_150004 [Candidatus Thorarchaeota archaeon]